jgi:hypothetical protein
MLERLFRRHHAAEPPGERAAAPGAAIDTARAGIMLAGFLLSPWRPRRASDGP